MKDISIVDTHVHFWNPNQIKYDWLESADALNRPFLLSDYRKATQGIGINKMVFVECNCQPDLNEAEVKWVEELAAKDKRIEAIVAYVDLTDTLHIDSNLEKITAHKLVRGIRHNIQLNKPGFATQPSFIEGVKKVLALNKHFELCITHDQMDECIELVKSLPAMPMMLNHCGKPGIKDGEINQWQKNIRLLSEFEHIQCKISGLLTEADLNNWTSEDITPYMDHVCEYFGSKRVVYGGDWPVCTLAGNYKSWYTLVTDWTKSWSEVEKLDFYYNNAIQFYRLTAGNSM